MTGRYSFTSLAVDLVAPQVPGVYALYDGEELIYYGSAEFSIRDRLKRHLRGEGDLCTKGASHFAWQTCDGPKLVEAFLQQKHKQAFGRLPRCNERVG